MRGIAATALRSLLFAAAFVAMLAVFFGLTAAIAFGQTVCGGRTELLARLADRYAERPVALGVQDNGTVLEVTASAAGTWTIIVTDPAGVTCAISSGEAWQVLSPPSHPEGVAM